MACEAMRAGTAPHSRSGSPIERPLSEWGCFVTYSNSKIQSRGILVRGKKDVDGRAKPGHDGARARAVSHTVMAGFMPAIHGLFSGSQPDFLPGRGLSRRLPLGHAFSGKTRQVLFRNILLRGLLVAFVTILITQ